VPWELFGTRKPNTVEYCENLGKHQTLHSTPNFTVPALFLHEKADQEVGCAIVARHLDFADPAIGLSANAINIRAEKW
jgi:hypothetical protein